MTGRSMRTNECEIFANATPKFACWVNPSEDWDQYEGLSFWVKGDGSQSYGGLEFIDGNDYSLRFGYCFPIESTDWVKTFVPWGDLVPELAAPTVDVARLCPQSVVGKRLRENLNDTEQFGLQLAGVLREASLAVRLLASLDEENHDCLCHA